MRSTGPALREPERKMARSLIDNLTAEWKPEKYHDRYRNELLDLLKKKDEGKPLPTWSGSSGRGHRFDGRAPPIGPRNEIAGAGETTCRTVESTNAAEAVKKGLVTIGCSWL